MGLGEHCVMCKGLDKYGIPESCGSYKLASSTDSCLSNLNIRYIYQYVKYLNHRSRLRGLHLVVFNCLQSLIVL